MSLYHDFDKNFNNHELILSKEYAYKTAKPMIVYLHCKKCGGTFCYNGIRYYESEYSKYYSDDFGNDVKCEEIEPRFKMHQALN